jgi:hypothetical protein
VDHQNYSSSSDAENGDECCGVTLPGV